MSLELPKNPFTKDETAKINRANLSRDALTGKLQKMEETMEEDTAKANLSKEALDQKLDDLEQAIGEANEFPTALPVKEKILPPPNSPEELEAYLAQNKAMAEKRFDTLLGSYAELIRDTSDLPEVLGPADTKMINDRLAKLVSRRDQVVTAALNDVVKSGYKKNIDLALQEAWSVATTAERLEEIREKIKNVS